MTTPLLSVKLAHSGADGQNCIDFGLMPPFDTDGPFLMDQ